MKKRFFPLTIASLLVLLAQPVMSQEKAASPSPSPSPSPGASPTPAVPAAVDADSSSAASKASAEESRAAEQKNNPAPAASPSPSAPPAAAASDADFLPEPTDASLGAPTPPPLPPEENLPTTEVAPNDLPNPDSLIPEGASDADEAPPAPPTIVENKFDKERKLQVRYQEVKLQALKDPAIRSLNEQAEKAKTDETKRQALREYYRVLFAKMTSIDAELGPKCATMQQAYLRRLGQYRVAPTIPLNPPPTPEPLAN